MRATSAALSAVKAKDPSLARACATSSATEGTSASFDRVGDRRVGELEWPEPDHALAPHAQRRLAGDEHPRAEPGDIDGRVDDLLEVVEDQQHLATAQMPRDQRVIGQAERAADRRHDVRGRPDRLELDHEAPVLEVVGDSVGHGQSEPCLAHAARPDERDDAALGAARVGERGELDRPARSAGRPRQGRCRGAERPRRVGRADGRRRRARARRTRPRTAGDRRDRR